MADPSASDAEREQRIRAIGALIWKDPERILEAVSQLRGTDAVLECSLRGGSMGTAIPRGSTLRIAVGRTPPYRVGEVVAFVQDGGICVHRVAYLGRGARARDHLVTQGDACFHPDAPVETRCVLGPVSEFRHRELWEPASDQASRDRSRTLLGRALLAVVARLMELDVRLARSAARMLRLRKEGAANAEAS